MTSSRYPSPACTNGSQVRGDNAWIVNFNNGNSNINNRDNNNRVRAVRGPAREFQGAGAQQVTLRDLHIAWKAARRQKVPSANQLDFDTNWADRLLKARMERRGLPITVRRATHALLRRSPVDVGVRYVATPKARALVPAHKQLANAPAGCGIPIGNLSSQFFANVYLDRLDQFVKHTLKAPRYLRYVDDFVLVHHDRAQLAAWKTEIVRFLADELRLALKEDADPRPLGDGIDFLGYVVRPTHTTVRRRVVSHARAALAAWESVHVANGRATGTPDDFRAVRSVWASYEGHFRHADSYRLHAAMRRRFPWLDAATRPRRFPLRLEGRQLTIPTKRTAACSR